MRFALHGLQNGMCNLKKKAENRKNGLIPEDIHRKPQTTIDNQEGYLFSTRQSVTSSQNKKEALEPPFKGFVDFSPSKTTMFS